MSNAAAKAEIIKAADIGIAAAKQAVASAMKAVDVFEHIKVQASGIVDVVTPTPTPTVPTPTVPTPTPVPPTPTPEPEPEPEPGGLYRSIGGIPAGLDVYPDGRDLKDLGGPALLNPAFKYKATGVVGHSTYAVEPKKILIPLAGGFQLKFAKNVKAAGWGTTGGGIAKSTNGKDAAIETDDGVQLCDFEVTKARGVGIRMAGSRLLSYGLHAHHNGTSGRMIFSRGVDNKPGSGFTEIASWIHHNNIGGMSSDAANKATQTSEYNGYSLVIEDEMDGGEWFDISCWNCRLFGPTIRRIKASDSSKPYKGGALRFELQCYGTYPSGVYGGLFEDVAGAGVAINESSNIELVGLRIGKSWKAIEFRQQTRADDPGDGGLTGPWPKDPNKRRGPGRPGADPTTGDPWPAAKLGWEVFNVLVKDVALLPGAGPIAYSNSNGEISPHTQDLRQSTNRIRFENVTGSVANQIKP